MNTKMWTRHLNNRKWPPGTHVHNSNNANLGHLKEQELEQSSFRHPICVINVTSVRAAPMLNQTAPFMTLKCHLDACAAPVELFIPQLGAGMIQQESMNWNTNQVTNNTNTINNNSSNNKAITRNYNINRKITTLNNEN